MLSQCNADVIMVRKINQILKNLIFDVFFFSPFVFPLNIVLKRIIITFFFPSLLFVSVINVFILFFYFISNFTKGLRSLYIKNTLVRHPFFEYTGTYLLHRKICLYIIREGVYHFFFFFPSFKTLPFFLFTVLYPVLFELYSVFCPRVKIKFKLT